MISLRLEWKGGRRGIQSVAEEESLPGKNLKHQQSYSPVQKVKRGEEEDSEHSTEAKTSAGRRGIACIRPADHGERAIGGEKQATFPLSRLRIKDVAGRGCT